MKKLILTLLLFCTYSIANAKSILNPAKIKITGDTLHYNGDINAEGLALFKQVTKRIKTPLRTITIRSHGGEIMAGMEIAKFIKNHNLNVEVYDICFSSCANYIFMAGNEKRIHPNTLLGWHGDATSSNILTGKKAVEKDIRKQLSAYINNKKDLEKVVQREVKKIFFDGPKTENNFYKKYNIDPSAIRYGHQNANVYANLKKGNYMGWTFSPQIMELLNIKNVKLVTGKWYPKAKDGKKLLYITKIQ